MLVWLPASDVYPSPQVPNKIEGMPLTDVLLVNIKLLSLAELKLITDQVGR
jgi:hypothetical protein